MHDPTASTHLPIRAILLAPQDAYDYPYYEQRIAEPALLSKAVAVLTLRIPFLAVPVGRTRKGGYLPVPCACIGFAVRDALRTRHGFPDLRLRFSEEDSRFVVEWGEQAPALTRSQDDVEIGRFYGYSEAATARHTRRVCEASAPRFALLDVRLPTPPGTARTSSRVSPDTLERKSRHV